MIQPLTFNSMSLTDFRALAGRLASLLECGDAILLKGPLGVGKTTFTRDLIRHMVGENIVVPSPSFTLVQSYDTPKGELLHVDLYRLNSPGEVEELGLIDQWDKVMLVVEWPEWIEPYCPENYLECKLEMTDNDNERSISLIGHGDWIKRLEALKQ